MTIQVLVATMHQGDHSLLKKMNIQTDAIVVNQCDFNSKETFLYKNCQILWLNTTERGLSRSRNMAINHASADICVLADDDEVFHENYADVILNSFSKDKLISLIRFEVCGIEQEFKKYADKEFKMGYLNSMKTSSVEIAFRRDAVLNSGIQFDEQIGAGTRFLMGEENAFLFDCLRHKINMKFVPAIIADLHIGESTWFAGYNEVFFVGKGAAFAAMRTGFTNLLILQFAIRKHSLYKNSLSLFNAVKQMIIGKRMYIDGKC